ncbi:MAG: hypothetical protein HRT36_08995 [Alphaproteobacteria bacterium]|nr:hypothetical protein [Alphaproteobacteria bacterium]
MQQALCADTGLQVGDRVAAIILNCSEAVIGILVTQSFGKVWGSCSSDFEAKDTLERFVQFTPKFLIFCDGYWCNVKTFDVTRDTHRPQHL